MMNETTNEMRYNPVTGEWVIYATARQARPDEMRPQTGFGSPAFSYEPSCPFCPGNEHMLPGILMELGNDAGGWKVRVVPNRYPALTPRRQHRNPPWTLPGHERDRTPRGHHRVSVP